MNPNLADRRKRLQDDTFGRLREKRKALRIIYRIREGGKGKEGEEKL